MATTVVLPSATGGGLERGVQNFLAVRQQRRDNIFRKDQQALDQRRVEVSERQLDVQEQGLAFERLLKIAPLVPPGTTLAESGFLGPTARQAFGDLNDTEFGALQGMELNPETVQTLIGDRTEHFLRELDPNNPDHKNILDRITLATSGLDGSTSQLRVEEQIAGMTFNALEGLQEDPTLQGNIARSVLGQEATVRIPGVIDPATNEEIEFESLGVAELYSRLAINRANNNTEKLKLDKESVQDIVGGLMEQAAKADIGLGRAFATNIVNSYNVSVGPDAARNSEGLTPLEQLYAGASPDERRSIELFTGAIRLGDNAYEQLLRQSPEGRRQLLLGGLGQFLTEDLNVPSDQMINALTDFLDSDIGRNIGIQIDGRGLLRSKFNFEPGPPGITGNSQRTPLDISTTVSGSNQPGADSSGIPAPANVDVVAAANLMRNGSMSEVDLRAEVGDAVVDAAIQLNTENP